LLSGHRQRNTSRSTGQSNNHCERARQTLSAASAELVSHVRSEPVTAKISAGTVTGKAMGIGIQDLGWVLSFGCPAHHTDLWMFPNRAPSPRSRMKNRIINRKTFAYKFLKKGSQN
jgi:hypothetical protein